MLFRSSWRRHTWSAERLSIGCSASKSRLLQKGWKNPPPKPHRIMAGSHRSGCSLTCGLRNRLLMPINTLVFANRSMRSSKQVQTAIGGDRYRKPPSKIPLNACMAPRIRSPGPPGFHAIAAIPCLAARESSLAAGPLGCFSPRSHLLTTPVVTFR